MPRTLALALALITATLAHAQPATQPAAEGTPILDLKLNTDSLKSWGTRKYDYLRRRGDEPATKLGEITLKTSLDDKAVTFEDLMTLDVRGKTIRWESKAVSEKKSPLRTISIDSKGEGDDEMKTFALRVEGEKAKVEMAAQDGQPAAKREIDLPADTVTFMGLMRLVTLLPRDAGKTYTTGHMFEENELHMKAGAFRFHCLGPHEMTIAGKPVTCTLLQVFDGQRDDPFIEAYVDNDGVLQRLVLDRTKTLELQRP
jgi:hypothetical protein